MATLDRVGASKAGRNWYMKIPTNAKANKRKRARVLGASLSCSVWKSEVVTRVLGQIIEVGLTRRLLTMPAKPKPSTWVVMSKVREESQFMCWW